MIFSRALATAALCCGLLSGTASAASSTFSLYAYGENMYGDVVYKNGLAYVKVGNVSTSNSYTPVKFTSDTDSAATNWVANPDNSTSSSTASNATWSNEMLFIPSNNSQIGFTSSPTDNQKTDVFQFMSGTTLVHDDGSYIAPFYAFSIDNSTYELRWNDTKGTRVTLRNVPSSGVASSKREVTFIA